MPIRKRNGHYYVRLQIAGRRIEVAAGTGATKADANALEAKIRSDARAGKLGRSVKRTIEEALVRWMEGEATLLKSYRNLVSKVSALEPYSARPIAEIVLAAETLKQDGIKSELAPATINRRLAILRRVANLAHNQWGWLDDDLAGKIKMLPGEVARHIYLTPKQVTDLAAACSNPGVRDAILLAAMSGLRQSELLALQPEQVRDGCIVLDSKTKSGKPRIIPLPSAALEITLPLPINYQDLRSGFEAAREAVGIDVRFHDLRHTYASWLVQSGANLTVVRDLLGHANLSVTSRYAHLSGSHLRSAVDGLPKLSGEKTGKNEQVGDENESDKVA